MTEARPMYESGMLKKWLNILQDTPELAALGTPTLCATVYYPIALLRMKLMEYSYEDFDTVEQALLRFCAAGVSDPAGLCQWMGLPSKRYVTQRLALLTAEGLLSGGKPTELGLKSLQEGHKVLLYDTEQIFQADGVLGLLLPREFQKQTDLLKRRSETRQFPHLMHTDAIGEESIRSAIQGQEKLRAYKEYRKDILNVNVAEVSSIQFVELRYMLVLLAQFKGLPAPLVFLPRHEQERKAGERFYSDVPLYLPRRAAQRMQSLAKAAAIVDEDKLDLLSYLCTLLNKEFAAISPQDVQKWMEEHTAFRVPACSWQDGRLCLYLDAKPDAAFTPLDMELMAAAAHPVPCPVEVELVLPTPNGGSSHTRLAVWPRAGALPPEAAELARHWTERSHVWLKNKAPRPLAALQMLLESDKETSDEHEL